MEIYLIGMKKDGEEFPSFPELNRKGLGRPRVLCGAQVVETVISHRLMHQGRERSEFRGPPSYDPQR
jgi:hypothetical protein